MKVPLAVVGLHDSDIEAAINVLKSGNLTMGQLVSEFEAQMASYLNVKNFVMVNSGSSANLLLVEALLRPLMGTPLLNSGDGVLVPAIAWPTTVWPLLQLGLNPIFVDVRKDNFAIDLESAVSVIRASKIPVKAIFPIHPLGAAIDHAELNSFCASTGLVQISDVCESLGSWVDGVHAGTSSLGSSFSFYFSHHITTMEGGGIATNDIKLADDLKSFRSHGWSRDRSDKEKWSKGFSIPESKFQFVSTGYNVRPMEIQAAIGLNQLKGLDGFVQKRRELASQVSQILQGSPVRVCGVSEKEDLTANTGHSWMMIPMEVSECEVSRAEVQDFLEKHGVETRPVLTGNFLRQPAMRARPEFGVPSDFPNADWISDNCFLIGAHHDYSENQTEHLLSTLLKLRSFAT